MSRTLEALRRIESRNVVVPLPPQARISVDREPPPAVCSVSNEPPEPLDLAWPLDPPQPLELPWPSESPQQLESPRPSEPTNVCWPHRCESSASYERLAARLLSQQVAGRPATLLFTSPGDSDGKTELLIALAPMLAARAQRRVLVVDADFRKSDLTNRLATCNEGLAGLLSGSSTIAEVACPTTTAQLSMLPHGDHFSLEEGGTQLSHWEAVLDDLKCCYPLVLLDAPSLAHAHVATMGSCCDGVCLVVRLGQTSRRAVREAIQVIEASGGRLLGCIAISG
jgi:Mrp family chromosome partitioning ATPase